MHKILLIIALALVFGTSAYISIFALLAIFPGAGIVIIFMGCGVEISKILLVVYLHRRFDILSWVAKIFYMAVIACLVLLTSAEVCGFLSMNHLESITGIKSNSIALDALEQEEMLLRNRIATIDKTLLGLPDSYVSKRLRERELAGYSEMQKRLTEIFKEKAVVENQQISDKAYSAPIFSTARIFNIEETRAASFFIFFLVFVLEPLSIGLAVAVSVVWLPQYPREKVASRMQSVTDVTEEQTQKKTDTSENLKKLEKPEVKFQISDDPVVTSIVRLVDTKGQFSGTMTELLEALNTDGVADRNGWPQNAHDLGKRIKRLEQKLSEQGIYVKRSRTQESRKVEIGRVKSIGNV